MSMNKSEHRVRCAQHKPCYTQPSRAQRSEYSNGSRQMDQIWQVAYKSFGKCVCVCRGCVLFPFLAFFVLHYMSSIFVNVVLCIFLVATVNVIAWHERAREKHNERKTNTEFLHKFSTTTTVATAATSWCTFISFFALSLFVGLLLPAQILECYRFSIFLATKNEHSLCAKWILFFPSSSQKCVTSLHGFFFLLGGLLLLLMLIL